MDEVFRALADPSRRELLDRLNARNGQTLSELCEGLGMARQSVSKHLAILEAANLVTAVRRGREKLHYLNAAPINDIAERWIDRYDRDRVDALSDLKHALEDTTMDKPEFVYTTYIRTTPERLFRALTEPAFTRRYWGTWFENDWHVGSPVTWAQEGVTITDPGQQVLEYDPPRRLAYTWHAFTPEWAAAAGIDDELRAKIAAERRSTVSFDIEPLTEPDGDVVKLTVVHDGFDAESTVAEMVSQGWPRVVAELKTMLETDAADEERAGYTAEVTIAAPRDRVFDALTTLDGLAAWWTPTVSGSGAPGGELTFAFADEHVVMRVERADRPAAVRWTCLTHTKLSEWAGTTLAFDLRDASAGNTRLVFRHSGLVPDLSCYSMCSQGWDHYLGSLTASVEGTGGSPWGSDEWTEGRAARAGAAS
jgi:uncharacterized protein YndB with AHSA1/START domain/DNA-binding transcriptional ArsR family regulator